MSEADDKKLRLIDGGQAKKDLPDLDDDELMLLSRDDHQLAFETLIRRHQSSVIGAATRFFNDRQQAREIAQDVFLALWAERKRYVSKGKFKPLLMTMTFNRCRVVARGRNTGRRKLEEVRARAEEVPQDETPLEALVEQSRAKVVREKLAQLPDAQREALILKYGQDMSIAEISRAMSKPEGTVKSHLFRGLKKLKAKMEGTA